MVSLIQSVKHKNQLAGLKVVAGLALSSVAAARKLLTKELLGGLKVNMSGNSHDMEAEKGGEKSRCDICLRIQACAQSFVKLHGLRLPWT